MKVKILLVICSTLFSLLFFELVAKFLVQPNHLHNAFRVIQSDSELIWRNIPNNSTKFYNTSVNTDQFGFRTVDKLANDANRSIRILSLGASPTFGWGVEAYETYPAKLQKKLGNNFEVINGGMVGYSSFQGKKLFMKLVDKIKPNLITISYVINDVDRLRFTFDSNLQDHELSLPHYIRTSALNFLYRLDFYWLMRQLLVPHSLDSLTSEQTEYFLKKSKRVDKQNYIANIKSILKIAIKHNIKVVLVIMPVNLPVNDTCSSMTTMTTMTTMNGVRECLSSQCSNDALDYNHALRDLATTSNIAYVDIAAMMGEKRDQYFLTDKGDPIHPNKDGHEFIANELAPVINKVIER